MNSLVEYTETMEPVRGVESVRYYVEKRAREVADYWHPNNPAKNEECYKTYLLAMYEILEIVYY